MGLKVAFRGSRNGVLRVVKWRFVYGEVEEGLFGDGDLVFLGLGFNIRISSFRLF